MFQQLRTATFLLIGLTVLAGGVYPAVVTAIAQLAFPHQANGSILKNADSAVGSELIGQEFTQPEYFWGRLSATGPVPYNAAASSGSNYGPLHPELQEAAKARLAALRANGLPESGVPVDLVTASGSGLDPHISPAAAEFQVSRISTTRRMTEENVRELVRLNTEGRQFGVLGEPRVNVLRLNMALDAQNAK
ncbi:MAG: potassium-transporting ATPase subunit KdpC [Planctomycetaceae bacterium]